MKIFCLDISKFFLTNQQITIFKKLLTEKPKQRLENLISSVSINYYKLQKIIFSELLTRYTLFVYAGINYSGYKLSYGAYGKPLLANVNNIFFNISHEKKILLCCAHTAPVGVDVVKINSDYVKEKHSCKSMTLKRKHWSIKEAFIKLHGKSMLAHAISTRVDTCNNEITISFKGQIQSCFTRNIIFKHCYYLSICTSNKYAEFSIFDVTKEQIIKTLFTKDYYHGLV